jgi:20S proteasome alpha/beta subunit
MDYLFGIRGKDFVMIVSDTGATQQIINIKHDEDKLIKIDDHKIMGIAGITNEIRPLPLILVAMNMNEVMKCDKLQATCIWRHFSWRPLLAAVLVY